MPKRNSPERAAYLADRRAAQLLRVPLVPSFARANVGRNHPDYGLHVKTHNSNKLKRKGI